MKHLASEFYCRYEHLSTLIQDINEKENNYIMKELSYNLTSMLHI